MKATVRTFLALIISVSGSLVIIAPASAAAADPIPITGDCVPQGWYVNPDEGALLPNTSPDGILLYGPSLTHHQTNVPLADLEPGSFTATIEQGVAPLFKVETTSPYSTLNYVGDGTTNLWWSSKITAGQPGGQGDPRTPAELLALAPYSDSGNSPVVFSFGVGYANDAGNKATLESVTFKGETYDFVCAAATQTSTTAQQTTKAGPTLPKTGSDLPVRAAIAGVAVLLAGVVILILARRRRNHA